MAGISEKETSMSVFGFIVASSFFALSVYLVKKSPKLNKKASTASTNGKATPQIKHYSVKGKFPHFFGLPLVEGSRCTLCLDDGNVTITGQGVNFVIDKDKILDISVQHNVDKHYQAVSSAGGAIAGALAFGAVGAAIGGRSRVKSFNTVSSALVITYDKENSVQCIAFKYKSKADVFARTFKKQNKSIVSKTVEL